MANNWLYTATPDAGRKGVTMNAYDWKSAWGEHGDTGDLDVHGAYQVVSWVRRCVELRCNALASIPVKFYRADSGDEAEYEYADALPHMIWMTEAARELYGAAYWLRLKNPFGFEKGFRWLYPPSIKPKYDKRKGLTHFERHTGQGEPERLKPEKECVYSWVPNIGGETGPGKGWVSGVLTEGAIANHMNTFASDFFERGAMPGTVLSVDGNPAQAELDRLQDWWKRFVGGVKRAWETVAVRASVTPVVIGYPTKDLAMPELLLAVRQQIVVAAGVPETMLTDAANYATAKEHRQGFYAETVVPEAWLVESDLNRQIFEPLGLRVVLDWQSMDIFQEDEEQRGQALSYYTTAGVPLDLAMELLGVELPNEMTYDEFRKRIEEEKEKDRQQALTIAQARRPMPGEDTGERRDELRRWERKSLKALKSGKGADVEFETDVLTLDEQGVIHHRLAGAASDEEVKAAFVGPFRLSGARREYQSYP